MYHDTIAFEIENVTGWNLMHVLAAEIMESAETSVVIESTRGPLDEDVKVIPEEPSTESETPTPTEVSAKSQETGTLPTDVSDSSALTSEETRMPITTSKEPVTITIEVSTASEKHDASTIVVPVTFPDVSTRVVETPPSTVETKQNETAGSTKPSPTAPFKTEPVIVATRSEIFTEGPSEVGAQEGDKCRSGTHDCSSNGRCIPLEESYDCECNLGFEGDGRICAGMLICFVLFFNFPVPTHMFE